MSEKGGDERPHYIDIDKGLCEGYYWCKLCKEWVLKKRKAENCPGMTKEDRKRIREREKRQEEYKK